MKVGEEVKKFCLEKFWPLNAFLMLQIRFSNNRLIKISMIYLDIKPEVEKIYDTIAMTTVINTACIRWLHQNCYLVREIFLVWDFFCCCVVFYTPSSWFPQSDRFGVRSRTVHLGGNRQDEIRGHIFGRWGIQGV